MQEEVCVEICIWDLFSDSDSEIKLGLEVGEEVVAGYNLYTSSRDSFASGTIKS